MPVLDRLPRNYPDAEGDYGRACSVEDLIGIIEVGPAQAPVLGDDPAATTFLPEHSLLVRQIAGHPYTDYSPAVAELPPQVVWDSRVEWTVRNRWSSSTPSTTTRRSRMKNTFTSRSLRSGTGWRPHMPRSATKPPSSSCVSALKGQLPEAG